MTMRSATLAAAAAATTLLTLAACSSSSVTTVPVTTGTAAPAAATSTQPATTHPASALTAEQVLAGLKAHGLPITAEVDYTDATDPNHLQGRPNGYTSSADFTDPRARAAQGALTATGPGVVNGGGVEVYPDASGARSRGTYIATITKAAPILGDGYDYVAGPVLLRLSTDLTPDQAAAYRAALTAVTGQPADAPTVAATQ